MLNRPLQSALLLWLLSCAAVGQNLSFPNAANGYGNRLDMDPIAVAAMNFDLITINGQNQGLTPLQSPSASVSKLDLKAPAKARREYDKGFQLLMGKDLPGAVAHLGSAAQIYPSFVAAHNALGSAYLSLNQNESAKAEFAKAVELDDHLPNSYLNLGCAELALKQYPAAEESLRKASQIAPLDLPLHTALAYGQYLNQNYPGVVDTARQVHERKHKGAAVVHFFAAGAWAAQNNLVEAQHEMETLLREDPKSGKSEQFRQILEQLKKDQVTQAEAKLHPAALTTTFTVNTPQGPTREQALQQAQQVLQNLKEKSQIAEAEAAPDPTCMECGKTAAGTPPATTNSSPVLKKAGLDFPGATFRAVADEVAIYFAATDHGKSATDLTASDIVVRDDNRPPHAILGFRNESQLPLRLGLIIDTSNSVTDRFSFEQAAATKFLQTVVTDKDDLAFVLAVNNSVLLVQDFSGDQERIAHAINQLSPGGGTAMWDAVSFAAEKLAGRAETGPVARVLVVISDGEDNNSSTSLKEAIASAQRSDVAVYTVSTREEVSQDPNAEVGDHALRTLSDLTGGAAFVPGSVRRLKGSLTELQQVIRGRYLVSYKPDSFQRDGRYRAIDIKAEKSGRKLKIYTRKGYYASVAQPASNDQ